MNSPAEVATFLAALEARFTAAKDPRAVFVSAYLQITNAVAAGIAAGKFADAAWTSRYLVEFARLYRVALEAWDAGNPAAVPKAWRIAFESGRDAKTAVLQDLLLGVNAHINNDLPIALRNVGIDPNRDTRHADHTAVNQILADTTDKLQSAVETRYSPILRVFDLAAGRVDEALANFSVRKARESAWNKAVLLTDSPGPLRAMLERLLSTEAGAFARGIVAPTASNSALRKALRAADGR